ncbi:hypothetical protein U1Q18_028488 [Sarracenia purpurea var. burkii]
MRSTTVAGQGMRRRSSSKLKQSALTMASSSTSQNVVRGMRDEILDEINAEEAEEVDEGGDERDDGSAFTQTDDKRRRRLAITEIEEGEEEYLK